MPSLFKNREDISNQNRPDMQDEMPIGQKKVYAFTGSKWISRMLTRTSKEFFENIRLNFYMLIWLYRSKIFSQGGMAKNGEFFGKNLKFSKKQRHSEAVFLYFLHS